jgi:hypothetical protein
MKAQGHVLTQEHVDKFDGYVRKWQTILNLSDWRIVRKDGKTSNMAEVFGFDSEARLCRYRLGRVWPKQEEPSDVNLESAAIHEILHVRFHDFGAACEEYGSASEQAGIAEHAIIIVMEKLFLKFRDLV